MYGWCISFYQRHCTRKTSVDTFVHGILISYLAMVCLCVCGGEYVVSEAKAYRLVRYN